MLPSGSLATVTKCGKWSILVERKSIFIDLNHNITFRFRDAELLC